MESCSHPATSAHSESSFNLSRPAVRKWIMDDAMTAHRAGGPKVGLHGVVAPNLKRETSMNFCSLLTSPPTHIISTGHHDIANMRIRGSVDVKFLLNDQNKMESG